MQTLTPGSFLQHGAYRIEAVLGQGGFGITYLATDVNLQRKVAIKEFFPKDYCEREDATSHVTLGTRNTAEFVNRLMAKFLKEARNIAKLNHPGIIRIFAAFEENNTAYYVMEYIEGESLSAMVKRGGPLPSSRAMRYVKEAGKALEYVHRLKINHLDIKPANIMVRRSDDTPVLIDFGLSKQYDSAGSQTSTTPTGISHGYAPLEQYNEGGVRNFSPQTDEYSLGATLYYLLSGVVPPHATTLNEEELTFPQGIPARLIAPISKSMSSARKDRYPDVATFIRALNLSDEEDDTQLPDTDTVGGSTDQSPDTDASSGGSHDRRFKPKMKWIIMLTAAVVAVGIGLLVWFNAINTTVSEPDGYISNHGYVDLGLPSGLKWATTNVGASSPSEYGNYYAWGKTTSWSLYDHSDSLRYLTLISDLRTSGIIDTSGELTMSHDVSQTKWRSTWRMPTRDEFQELIDNCTWSWISMKRGYKVTGPNGNSIFLPAAGFSQGNSPIATGANGFYWSTTPYEDGNGRVGSFCLRFHSGDWEMSSGARSQGRTVRPVSK